MAMTFSVRPASRWRCCAIPRWFIRTVIPDFAREIIGNFVGADAPAVRLPSRATMEGSRAGANSGIADDAWKCRTRALSDPDAVRKPEGTPTRGLPASGSCANLEFGRRLLP